MSDASDRVEIADLIARYGLFFDANDGEGFASIFAADGRLVRPDGAVVQGSEELAAMAAGAPPMQHFPGPPAIDLDGDAAVSRSRVIALRVADGALTVVFAGEYRDQMVKHSSGWRIAERRLVAWLPPELTGAVLAGA